MHCGLGAGTVNLAVSKCAGWRAATISVRVSYRRLRVRVGLRRGVLPAIGGAVGSAELLPTLSARAGSKVGWLCRWTGCGAARIRMLINSMTKAKAIAK